MTTDRGREPTRRKLRLATGALIVIGIVALFGGFRTAPAAPPRLVAVGQAIDLGPLRVKPLRAWIDAQCPLDYSAGAPNSCLSFEAEVTNLTNASRSGLSDLVRLVQPSVPKATYPTTELVRDRWVLGALHPRLPERVVVSWKLTPQNEAPTRITLALWSMEYKKRDNLLGGEGWFTPK